MPSSSQQQNGFKFNQDVIKGRIAETIIEQLFFSMGYEVYRYGIENTIPGLMLSLTDKNSKVAQLLRKMPDFVVKEKSGKVSFIEVKYRWNGEFGLEDLKEAYPYDDVFVILVSKNSIKCITVEELRSGQFITSNTGILLGDRDEFKLNRNKIIEFCNFSKKLFENV